MPDTTLILPSSEVRANWSELLQQINDNDQVVIITQYGKPLAILVRYGSHLLKKFVVMYNSSED